MTSDKIRFVIYGKYDGHIVRWGDDIGGLVQGRGFDSLHEKNNKGGVLYVKVLKNNLLNIWKLMEKGYGVHFKNDKWKIFNVFEIEDSTRSRKEK